MKHRHWKRRHGGQDGQDGHLIRLEWWQGDRPVPEGPVRQPERLLHRDVC